MRAGVPSFILLHWLNAVRTCIEAAKMDGANKWQIIRHIDLPGIMPTVTMMLIMEMGKVMNIGFSKSISKYREWSEYCSQRNYPYLYL